MGCSLCADDLGAGVDLLDFAGALTLPFCFAPVQRLASTLE